MDKCIFCKIVKGDIPSYKLYEDNNILAFLDVNPKANGHTLIVPKKHYKDLFDIDEETINKIFKLTKNLAGDLKSKLNCDGFSLVQNNGNIQEVKHFHLHIIPTYNNDNILLETDKIHKILSN